MMSILSKRLLLALCGSGLFAAGAAHAATIGSVSACYACTNPTQFDPGVNLSDGLGFSFTNTTSTAITNGVFTIMVGGDNGVADSFRIGTIGAGATVFVIPGLSMDGQPGHTFFSNLGGPRDTSDAGPVSNSVPFQFTGVYGATTVSTGIFTPAATYGLSQDGSQQVNFLGGPNGDGCNQCFEGVVATISTPGVTPPTVTPEPASLALLGTGALAGLGAIRRRFSR